MKNLKRLGLSLTLISILAVAAFAGETPTGPCAPPAPGETPTGPCAAAQITPGDAVAPGETSSPPASKAGAEFSVSDVAIDLLQSVLLIF
jgi:hypothetical protein